jgi:UDP-N-acetylmuramyl pentapeptide phosphotransferase/UDP-N-acetylglucosamine-1-phosphate transferase
MSDNRKDNWMRLFGVNPTGFSIPAKTAGSIALVFGIPALILIILQMKEAGAMIGTAGIAMIALVDTLLDLRDNRRSAKKRVHAVIICVFTALVMVLCFVLSPRYMTF